MADALSSSRPAPTLIGAALPGFGPRAGLLRAALLVIAGSVLMVLAAKIKVPFWPVPMTMQTFVVLALGAGLGPRRGLAAVALYIAYGLAGLPVFTNTPPVVPGPLYLLGPTGGFLLGFLPAAAIAGWAAVRGATLPRLVGGLIVADLVILVLGCAWLAFGAQMASGATGIGFAKAFAGGVQPFLLGEALKVALTAALVTAGWSALGQRR